MAHQFDVLIVGGGMVGASLALALKDSPLNIGLIEAQSIKTDSQPTYDDRGIALSYGTQRIFETMELWPEIVPLTTAIKTIHVSDKGHFGVTRLSADQQDLAALGQVVVAKEFGALLNKKIAQQNNLTLLSPHSTESVKQQNDSVTITLDNGEQCQTKLLVAADGKNSSMRQLLDLGYWQQEYQQTAITANISTDKPHQGTAYERFTMDGPIALLPLSEQRYSLVWTMQSGVETELLNLPDEEFLQQAQQHFGYRAGRFTRVGKRAHYPLDLIQMDQMVQSRIVFIGNAAHSLHPIAGQGLNLGMRDVAVLAELLFNANDCGNARLLHDYKAWRQADQDQVVKATDKLVRLSRHKWLGHFRGASLALMDCIPLAKKQFSNASMGLSQKQARLTRGVPL